MAFSYKTPGVYLEEIVKLPPSVASVETAIPCFFGVTQKATETTDDDLNGVSKKINSLADYEFYFGFPDVANATVVVNLNTPSTGSLSDPYYNNMYYSVKHYFDNGGGPCYIHSIGNYTRTGVDADKYKNELAKLDLLDEVTLVILPDLAGLENKDQYYDVLNSALQKAAALQDKFVIIDVNQEYTNNKVDASKSKKAFRDIISNNVDAIKYGAAYFPYVQTTYNYNYNTANIAMTFSADVQKIETEVTINNVVTKVQPYKILNLLEFRSVNNMYILNTYYNEFVKSIFIDTIPSDKMDASIAAINNKLPKLLPYFDQDKIDALFIAKDNLLKPYVSNAFSLEVEKYVIDVATQNVIAQGATVANLSDAKAAAIIAAQAAVNASISAISAADAVGNSAQRVLAETAKSEAEDVLPDANSADTAQKVKDASTAALTAANKAKAVSDTVKTAANFDTLKNAFLGLIGNRIKEIYDAQTQRPVGVDNTNVVTINNTFLAQIGSFFNSAFEAKLKEAFLNISLSLPPSPAIAGVYASVDRTRGVWKAPANVSLNAVVKPAVLLSDLDQEDFNVDAENGKSINCIRQFVGRGNLVWGARTLAGNNNEWKYVNVRRFFNMVEESCQNATRHFVFEPNDANTWVRVKGMIDNYLTNLWRSGALQGAKPEHAFYVYVGLDQTMTADDILNGLLIVEIGLAVVRPAEFIVLRFSHKLAVS